MIDAVIRDGYCVAQEYLPAASKGDVRLFVMNGRPLMHDGKYAAFRRVNKTGDARSNMHSGGESEPVEVTDKMLRLVEIVRPKLVSRRHVPGRPRHRRRTSSSRSTSSAPAAWAAAANSPASTSRPSSSKTWNAKSQHRKYYGARMTNVELATL